MWALSTQHKTIGATKVYRTKRLKPYLIIEAKCTLHVVWSFNVIKQRSKHFSYLTSDSMKPMVMGNKTLS